MKRRRSWPAIMFSAGGMLMALCSRPLLNVPVLSAAGVAIAGAGLVLILRSALVGAQRRSTRAKSR